MSLWLVGKWVCVNKKYEWKIPETIHQLQMFLIEGYSYNYFIVVVSFFPADLCYTGVGPAASLYAHGSPLPRVSGSTEVLVCVPITGCTALGCCAAQKGKARTVWPTSTDL